MLAGPPRAHLFLLAEPVNGRAGMLLGLTHGHGWQQRTLDYVQGSLREEELTVVLAAAHAAGFSPDLVEIGTFGRRPDGVALTSAGLGLGRVIAEDGYDPESVAELEIREDGGLRVFLGRLSDHLDNQPS